MIAVWLMLKFFWSDMNSWPDRCTTLSLIEWFLFDFESTRKIQWCNFDWINVNMEPNYCPVTILRAVSTHTSQYWWTSFVDTWFCVGNQNNSKQHMYIYKLYIQVVLIFNYMYMYIHLINKFCKYLRYFKMYPPPYYYREGIHIYIFVLNNS